MGQPGAAPAFLKASGFASEGMSTNTVMRMDRGVPSPIPVCGRVATEVAGLEGFPAKRTHPPHSGRARPSSPPRRELNKDHAPAIDMAKMGDILLMRMLRTPSVSRDRDGDSK